MLVAVMTTISCQIMSPLGSVLQLLACVTNYIRLLSGPCNLSVLQKCKLCGIFFFSVKMQSMSVLCTNSKSKDAMCSQGK